MAGRNTVEIILSASDRASGALRQAFGQIEGSSSRVMGALKAGAAIAAGAMATLGGYVAKIGVDYNSMVENSTVAWNTLLGSQDKAKKMLQDIANFAKQTQFDTTGVDIMAKYMHNAGYEGKALFDQLTKVADVSGAFNIPAESAQELARQMSQVQQAGLAYTEDLNILQDRGVPIYKAIAEQLHTNVAGVKKLASQGELTADVYNKAFDSIANSVKGASEKQSQTFTGMISTMQDNLNMIAGELSKPLFENMKKGLEVIQPLLEKFLSGLKDGGIAGGLAAIFPPSISNTIDRVKEGINGVFAIFDGNKGKGISMLDNFGLGSGTITVVMNTVDKVKSALNILKGAFQIFNGDGIGGVTLLTKMGFSTDTIVKVVQVVNGIKSTISGFVSAIVGYYKGLFSGDGNIGQSFVRIFNVIKSIALPILQDAVKFIKEQIDKIKQFWDENGAQIIQAVKNVWNVIATIFEFIAPVILAVVKMLWESVKGVIDGALKIIMGLVKVFAGLFTGDFSKMWEGIKQLFLGAIEFVWNAINLLMFGRILSGIKSFVISSGEAMTGFFTKAVEIFKNLDTYLFDFVQKMVTNILGWFGKLADGGQLMFGTLRHYGESIFSALWGSIRAVIGYIYDGTIGKFSSMATGARGIFNGLLDTARSIFNAIKSAITNPIETAQTIISKAVSGIRSLFSSIGNKIKIPLPHFELTTGHKTILGKSISYPTGFDLKWYDKGGVFYGPQVIGVGERRPEFVGALDDLRKIVREESQSSNPINITLNYNGSGSESDALQMTDIIETEMNNRFGIKMIFNGVK